MEDLEFSVGSKQGQWELKDASLGNETRTNTYQESSTDYSLPGRHGLGYQASRDPNYKGVSVH